MHTVIGVDERLGTIEGAPAPTPLGFGLDHWGCRAVDPRSLRRARRRERPGRRVARATQN
jgi:hypothetical protein